MFPVIIFTLFASIFQTQGCQQFSSYNDVTADSTLKVMSYNIRYNTPNDGDNAWPNRSDDVGALIGNHYKADIVGLQEALKGQIEDLERVLTRYEWVGVGRTDGHQKGEFSPIFYNADRFELLATDTFWLSGDPYIPGSKSWDAAITRIATWAFFKDNESGEEFYFINTHFDHRGKEARAESAKLLVNKIPKIVGKASVIITGDFNAREESKPYQVMTGSQSPYKDAFKISESQPKGPMVTFNNWKELSENGNRIDYIFVNEGVGVLNHTISDYKFNEYFPSDHLPVIAEVKWK